MKSQPQDFAPTCCPLGWNLVRCGILLTSYGVSCELHNHIKHKCLKNMRLAFQGRPWILNSLSLLDVRKMTKTELPGTRTHAQGTDSEIKIESSKLILLIQIVTHISVLAAGIDSHFFEDKELFFFFLLGGRISVTETNGLGLFSSMLSLGLCFQLNLCKVFERKASICVTVI